MLFTSALSIRFSIDYSYVYSSLEMHYIYFSNVKRVRGNHVIPLRPAIKGKRASDLASRARLVEESCRLASNEQQCSPARAVENRLHVREIYFVIDGPFTLPFVGPARGRQINQCQVRRRRAPRLKSGHRSRNSWTMTLFSNTDRRCWNATSVKCIS